MFRTLNLLRAGHNIVWAGEFLMPYALSQVKFQKLLYHCLNIMIDKKQLNARGLNPTGIMLEHCQYLLENL